LFLLLYIKYDSNTSNISIPFLHNLCTVFCYFYPFYNKWKFCSLDLEYCYQYFSNMMDVFIIIIYSAYSENIDILVMSSSCYYETFYPITEISKALKYLRPFPYHDQGFQQLLITSSFSSYSHCRDHFRIMTKSSSNF